MPVAHKSASSISPEVMNLQPPNFVHTLLTSPVDTLPNFIEKFQRVLVVGYKGLIFFHMFRLIKISGFEVKFVVISYKNHVYFSNFSGVRAGYVSRC